MGYVADRDLAVLRGVADVLGVGADDVGKLLLEGVDDVAGLVQAQRGLGQISHAVGVGHLELGNLGDVRNHLGGLGRLAQRALNLVVVAVPDEHQRVALLGELDGLDVDLGHQRTGGVDDAEAAALAQLAHRGRDAMGRIDDSLAVGHIVDFMNKNRALVR